MKKEILNRYLRTSDDEIIIDVASSKVEDLFNDYDRHASYVKKELDQDLVEYLINSANEIGDHKFLIQFRFTTRVDTNLISRVKTSISNYFKYLIALEAQELRRMARTSLILFVIGAGILSISVIINQKMTSTDTFIANVFAEGLNVAAWVSLWHAIATFLISWAPRREQMKMYRRISQAKILFPESTE